MLSVVERINPDNSESCLPRRRSQEFPGQCLLRKEVIQPHVPVGLPCYDLAPVTGLTFGDSLPCGLVCRLRVLPAPIA